MFHLDFWNNGKRKLQAEQAVTEKAQQEARREREESTRILSKSAAINTRSIDVLNQTIENGKDLQEKIALFNAQVEDFQKKVDENQRLQRQLQKEQSRLSEWEEDLKNRAEKNRKEEISIHIRSESVKKEEQRVAKKDSDLEHERQNIKDERLSMKERVEKAEKIEKESIQSKEKYEEKQKDAEKQKKEFEDKLKDLDSRESRCSEQESDIKKRLGIVEEKERDFSKREEEMKKSFETEKSRWETDRAEIENRLNEKIKEYDRKLADMEAVRETVDNIKFDDSEDGKKAKIVVKETIRVSMKTLEETLQKFRELDEKYASGTFKGFSIPIDEISLVNEELKLQYAEVKEHAESTGLDFSAWLEKIENCILDADKNFKSFFFAECYRSAIEGLSYCKGYADIINILNEYAGSSGTTEENSYTKTDDWFDYYEFLFREEYDDSEDYTQFDEKTIKKQYHKMAKKYHPDTAPDEEKNECSEIIKLLNKIWEILSDPDKRAEYDSNYLEKRSSKKH